MFKLFCHPLTELSPIILLGIVSTPVQSSLQEQVFLYNYDEGHAGRFSVPNTPGGSVSFDDIISRPDAVSYILEQLTFYPNAGSPRSTAELIAFVPGLNTLHQPFPGTTSTVERLIHYSKVMNLPMAQIHLGTALDQGDVIIKPQSAASLLPLLEPRLNSLPRFLRPSIGEDGSIVFGNFTVDGLQVALSYPNLIDIPIKQSIRKLLSSKKPVTILAYSRGSLEVEAALRQYIQENDISFEELRGQVTVLSIGNACRNWPDGPAYLHLSTRTDPLTRSRGVYADRPQGSGRDAVFIECDSPFHPESFDNHNFGSITSQYLSLVLRASKATSIRDLWDKAHMGEMVIPSRTAETINAMIHLTGGLEWLWERPAALRDTSPDFLPNTETAKSILREVMGEEFLDTLLENFRT